MTRVQTETFKRCTFEALCVKPSPFSRLKALFINNISLFQWAVLILLAEGEKDIMSNNGKVLNEGRSTCNEITTCVMVNLLELSSSMR